MRAYKLTFYTLAMLTLAAAYDVYMPSVKESHSVPQLDTFASYEDMQRYFISRNHRTLRQLENPTDDSYIKAYNEYNEEPIRKESHERIKRAASELRQLPNEPTTMLRFEITDAVEPSAEVKEIIRQHRSREEKLNARPTSSTKIEKKLQKSKARTLRSNTRAKRATANAPFNLQLQLIPFELADAREPDVQTKALIKRMRALELEQLRTSTAAPATTHRVANLPVPTTPTLPFSPGKFMRSKAAKYMLQRKGKRIRRAAPQTPPQMFKFELADAAVQPTYRTGRESSLLKLEPNATQPLHHQSHAQSELSANADADAKSPAADLSIEESQRLFFYKEAPAVKAKKSINSLPHQVQKAITHLLKENHSGKAYVKYIPAQQMDYRQLKSAYGSKLAQPAYANKLSPASYVKYVQPLQKAEQLQVQIHPVPVVEKMRYIYTPVAGVGGAHLEHEQHAAVQAAAAHAVQAAHAAHNVHAVAEAQAAQVAHAAQVAQAEHEAHVAQAAHAAQAQAAHAEAYAAQHYQAHAADAAAISHPIVVHDAGAAQQHQQAPIEVHHAYAADLSQVHNEDAAYFRPSKPDPLLNDNKLAADVAVPVEHYKYEVYTPAPKEYAAAYAKPQLHAAAHAHQQPQAEPLIKIEYHAPADALKENYKEMPEFKQLSSFIGKSTDDQIHGLTYLLAKEMQNKLQLQRQHGGDAVKDEQLAQRAPDNTAPLLFHPEQAQHHQRQQQPQQALSHAGVGLHTGRLIGMAKSKEYIPIVEQAAPAGEQKFGSAEQEQPIPAPKQYAVLKMAPKVPVPNSFMEYGQSPKGQGNKAHLLVEQVIHHPTVTHHGSVSVGAHHGLYAAAQESGEIGGGHAEAAAHVGGGDVAGGVIKHGGGGHSMSYGIHHGDGLQYASKYAFGYRIRDFHTGNDFGHKQNRDLDGVTRGQYHILLPDGRIQNVIYHADDTGFHADVSFETGH